MRLPGYNVQHACGYARTGPIWQVEDQSGRIFLAKLMNGVSDLTAPLDAPGCVKIATCVQLTPNRYVLLMDKVAGRPLAELAVAPKRQLQRWLEQVESALRELHARGRSHGDVTLANILVDKDSATLIDITPDADHHTDAAKCAADFAALNAIRKQHGITGVSRRAKVRLPPQWEARLPQQTRDAPASEQTQQARRSRAQSDSPPLPELPAVGQPQQLATAAPVASKETELPSAVALPLHALEEAGIPTTAVRGALLAARLPETEEKPTCKPPGSGSRRARRSEKRTSSCARPQRARARKQHRQGGIRLRRGLVIAAICVSAAVFALRWFLPAQGQTPVQYQQLLTQLPIAAHNSQTKARSASQSAENEVSRLIACRNRALAELVEARLFDCVVPGSPQAIADAEVIAKMRELRLVYRDLASELKRVEALGVRGDKQEYRLELVEAGYRVCELDSETDCDTHPARGPQTVIMKLAGTPARIVSIEPVNKAKTGKSEQVKP